ncbi:hypothetical protein ACA910_020668 [Epithemia clementina (nom. ined.)]
MPSLSSSFLGNESLSSFKDERNSVRGHSELRDQIEVTGQIATIQAILIIVLAAQIPFFREEICEVIELQYHGFASTIMFCLFRSFVSVGKKRVPISILSTQMQEASKSSEASLVTFDEGCCDDSGDSFYMVNAQCAKLKASEAEDSFDEWGHFADFDEAYHEEVMAAPVKPRGLTTLEEIIEEE